MRQKRRVLTILLTLAIVLVMMPVSGLEFVSAVSGEEGDGSEGFYTPLKIESGFNIDGVYDDSTAAKAIDGAGYCYYSFDGEGGSLPLGGVIRTNSGKCFKLGDYTADNVLRLDSVIAEKTLSFSEGSKGSYSSIALLVTGGDGGGSLEAIVHFKDSEEIVTGTFTVPDWSRINSQKMYDCGRWKLGSGEIDAEEGFGLFEFVIDIPSGLQNHKVDHVELKLNSLDKPRSTICIFAASGISTSDKKTLIFDADGGTAAADIITAAYGEIIELPAAERRNCSFEGWFNGNTKVVDDENKYVVNDDVVLKAHWRETGTYILCDLGYSGRTVKLFRQTDNTFEHPKRTGYSFSGFAAEHEGVAIPESNLVPENKYYALWNKTYPLFIQGMEVTERNCADVLGDGKVSYDIENNELTLDNATINAGSIERIKEEEYAAIYREGPLKLKLIGKNTIDCSNAEGSFVNGIYIYKDKLDIIGDGSLTINASTDANKRAIYGIYAESAVIASNLSIVSDSPETDAVYGLSARNELKIDAPLDITINAKHSSLGLDQADFSGSTIINKVVKVNAGSQMIATGIYSGSINPVFNADIEINVSSNDEATGISFDNLSDYEPNEIVFNNSGVVINAVTEGMGAYGITNADKMHVKGDSNLSVSASVAMFAFINTELDMEMGAKLEAHGSKQAFDKVSLTDNTRALGIKTKLAGADEYTEWNGSTDSELWTENIKGVLIPGKDIKHVKKVDPTCTKDGNKEHWTLTTGEVTTYYKKPVIADGNKCTYEELVIPATGHLFSDEFTTDTEPTCTEDGSKSKHCTVCGESNTETRTAIPALGHEWDEGVVTKEGEKIFTCRRCGDQRKETIPPDGTKPAPVPGGSDASAEANAVTVNSRSVSAKTVNAALKKAEADGKAVTVIVLGKNVKKIKKGAFKNCGSVRTLEIKTKKLKKASVKKSLKGSRITRIRVRVSSKAKTNKKYIKKYKKLFTKKNAGRKVKVS